ncbi:MAG TPA: outer membrane protein transport protein [Microvirga sp.]|jgi:long-chain fatty acid transport protein|nr:outer membrane protein transport protein [Microvirga sp.]
MSRFHRSLTLAAVSAAALIAAQGSAQAGAFGVREQSATAQGYSFAGAASGSGRLSSMFWNPATITMAPGWQSENHLSIIIPEVEITPRSGTPLSVLPLGPSGDIGQDAALLAGYTSYQVNDRLWVGYSSSAPYGLVTDPNQAWAGQTYSRSSKIFSLNFNPIVGFKVNEWLSIAGGPTVQYFDVRLKQAAGFSPTSPSVILDGDDIGFGFTAGLTLTPFAGTTIGVGFRSSVHHELEGSIDAPAGVFAPVAVNFPIKAKLNTPEQVTIGLSQAIGPAFTLHVGFEWTNWSRLKSPAIVNTAINRAVSDLPLNYEDGYMYSVGFDYRFNDRLTLRAGLAYEESPITTETRSTRLPDDDRIWASLGATYQWSEKLSFDVAYTHIFAANNTKIDIRPGHQDFNGLPFVADVDSNVNIISAAVRYRWDDPVKPIPAPIVRKN